ncbi:MAG: hypothetical protein GY811_04735 [Myxococcales bacterium]|nr:hypothetical protein [Myxococcales bacterium]
MKSMIVLLCLTACGQQSSSTKEKQQVRSTRVESAAKKEAMSKTKAAPDDLLQHLLRAPTDQHLLIPGLGALTTKRYAPYTGSDGTGAAAKHLVFWVPDGELLDSVRSGQIQPFPAAADRPAILGEWQATMEVVLPHEESSLYAWGEALYGEIVGSGEVTVPKLGRFSVIEMSTGRKTVQFKVDTDLRRRVIETRQSSED